MTLSGISADATVARSQLEERLKQGELVGLPVSFQTLRDKIKDGTVTVADIDAVLEKSPGISPSVREYLLTKKADLLFRQGDQEESLLYFQKALDVEESPSTLALLGTVLLQMGRIDEATGKFDRAYALRDKLGNQKKDYVWDIFNTWSLTSVFQGLSGIVEQDADEAIKWAEEYLSVLEKATAEGMPEAATVNLQAGEHAEPGVAEDIEEWELMVKLLSIKDPIEGWRALGKAISERWPKGLSAVEAIREMRE